MTACLTDAVGQTRAACKPPDRLDTNSTVIGTGTIQNSRLHQIEQSKEAQGDTQEDRHSAMELDGERKEPELLQEEEYQTYTET
jgi:hypothetical protein